MITPDEIKTKDFTRGVRGYKEEEVDQFLDLIAIDVNALLRDNASLRNQLHEMSREMGRQRSSDSSVLGTLEAAKALMADISVSAEKRAEIVLKNAELDAELIRRDARTAVENMTEEAQALSKRWELFSARFRNLLETELERFDSFSAGLTLGDPTREKPEGIENDIMKSAAKSLLSADPNKTFIAPKQK